jgi:vitamin B12 transporter
MFHRNTLAAAIALAFSLPSQAQTADTELEPVVVTANRVAKTASETLSAVTVIKRQDIEQQQAQSLPELLDGLAGIGFANNGGPGKTTSLYMRGTNSGHTLILIDGVRIGSATDGTAALQDIPLEQIDHIEIVRGPRASLYGSDAIGGVIQIFTRRGVQAPVFTFGGGSRSTFETSASGGFGSADAWLNLFANGYTTHGINATSKSAESDTDGYWRYNTDVRGGGRLGDKLDYDLQLMHTTGVNEYDGAPNVTALRQDLVAGNLRYALNDNLTTRLKLAQSQDASKNYDNGTTHDADFDSRFDTRTNQLSWQNELTFTQGQQLVGGVDYQNDKVTSSTEYDHSSRVNKAVFGQYLADFGATDVQLAGRHDQNEQFGDHDTGSLAAGYTFSPTLRVYASHATAFKAPTFNDLYYPGAGNADLKPEQSHTSELGLGGKGSNFDWQTSAFRTRITNLIAWAPTNDPDVWLPSNIDNAHINGLELSGHYRLGNTRLGANATFLDPRNASSDDNDGKLLPRRARHTARFEVDHQFGAWGFGSTLKAVGKRYDDAANATKLGGYATLDLRAEYAINAEWKIQTRLENVLDRRYQTASTYNQVGFGAFVNVRYQPKL